MGGPCRRHRHRQAPGGGPACTSAGSASTATTRPTRNNHGGPEQAIYVYAREDLDWWAGELGRDVRNGAFGENIVTAGLDISGALIGERWRLGTAVVQITSPRIPCGTFRQWTGEKGWVKRFAAAGRPGAYLRVLEEGTVTPGDAVTVLDRPGDGAAAG